MNTRLPALFQWFSAINIRCKVLFTNIIIVVLWIIADVSKLDSYYGHIPKSLADLGAIAVVITLASATVFLNFLWLKFLLTPLEDISKSVKDVKEGRLSIISRAHLIGGTITERCVSCVDSFNKMLDTLTIERQISQRLAMRVMSAQEEERKRIARELHDEASQLLTTLSIRLEQLKLMPKCAEDPAIQEELDELKQLSQHILVELRRLAFNLRPTMLDNLGLRHALFWLFREQVQKKGIQVQFNTDGEETRLNDNIELTLFRISQEAATNIVKYAKATNVKVDLRWAPLEVSVEITDNGIGFDPEKRLDIDDGHMGLLGMKERVLLLSGAFNIISAVGRGTTIKVSIPTNLTLTIEPGDASIDRRVLSSD